MTNTETLRDRVFLSHKKLSSIKWCNYTPEEVSALKRLFWASYSKSVSTRNRDIILEEKDKAVLNHVFNWCIMSKDFNGDLHKGLYVAAGQGFGKDVLLSAVVDFFAQFDKTITEYIYSNFCNEWFTKSNELFRRPIKINDIKESGKMKRERTSLPFLEFLDFREQLNLRRGLLVSSNLTPSELQDLMEYDQPLKRLEERIKECFNVILIKNTKSKRVSNQIII
jgi:predicted ATPase